MTDAQRKAVSAIGEAAAEWVVRLHGSSTTPADKAAFMEWLRESPVHVKEYLQAEAVFTALQEAAQHDSRDARALLDSGASSNVVGLGEAAMAPLMHQRESPRSRKRFIAAIAAILMLAATSLVLIRANDIVATGVGEQRRVSLADGTIVELNTRSKVRIDLSADSRDVYLLQGEAFFTVAQDAKRPFRVLSDAAVVRAIGTQFNIYRRHEDTIVTVLEGRVAILPARAANQAHAVELSAGSEIAVAGNGKVSQEIRARRSAAAWRQHRLIFENETLEAVAAEFNRYNTVQLVIEDPALAGERINGVFNADKPEELLGFLTGNGAVRLARPDESRIVLTRRH